MTEIPAKLLLTDEEESEATRRILEENSTTLFFNVLFALLIHMKVLTTFRFTLIFLMLLQVELSVYGKVQDHILIHRML